MGVALLAPLVLIGLSACTSVEEAAAEDAVPTATLNELELTVLTLQAVEYAVEVEIVNPYDRPMSLTLARFALDGESGRLFEGRAELFITIAREDTERITVPIVAPIGSLTGPVEPGAVIPWSGQIVLDAEVRGVRLELPVAIEGVMPIPGYLDVKLVGIRWIRLEPQLATGLLRVQLHNRNDFAIDLLAAEYVLNLDGNRIAEMRQGSGRRVLGAGDQTIEVPFEFNPSTLGTQAFKMLTGPGARHELSGTLAAGTEWGELVMPFVDSGEVEFERGSK
jgi:LEA14-like dessication related protein